MRDEEDKTELVQQVLRQIDAALEANLRQRGVLAPDDAIVEVTWAKSAVLTAYVEDHAAEPKVTTLNKGTSCCFSSMRLFVPNARLVTDLEWLWHAECSEETLSAVFSAGRRLLAVRLMVNGLSAAQVAGFTGRLLAQRDLRVAELPDEPRQRLVHWSSTLERRGMLEAALAEPIPAPRTRIGAWLRAVLLVDPELMTRHRDGTGWSRDETPVLRAAFGLQVRRYFGPSPGASAVPEFMSSLTALVKLKGQRVDLLRAEAMLRSALSGSGPGFDDILSAQWLQLACVLAGFVAHQLEMSPRAIDLLITRCEQSAFEQGHNPPPPANRRSG